MKSMSKGEYSARTYKIKKHTSDAVMANEKGCKIRIGRIAARQLKMPWLIFWFAKVADKQKQRIGMFHGKRIL